MTTITLQNRTIFITGAAGFIGANLILELLRSQSSIHIVGIDNMSDYYDVCLKKMEITRD